MLDSADRILSIRCIDGIAMLVIRLIPATNRRILLPSIGIAISLLPILAEIVVNRLSESSALNDSRALIALTYFFGVNLIALWCPYSVWHRLIRLGSDIDHALPHVVDRASVVEWLDKSSRPHRWYPKYLLFGVAASATSVWGLAPRLNDEIAFSLGSHLTILLSAVIFFENAHWVLRLPGLMMRITRRRMRVIWHDPASTPVFQSLTRLLGWTAFLGLVGGVLIGLPIIYAYTFDPSIPVGVIALIPPVVMLATFFYTGLRPQYAAYRAVRDAKARVLQTLQANWPGLADSRFAGVKSQMPEGLQVWRAVAEAPNWIVTRDTAIQYGASLVTTMIATTITLILALLA